LATTSTPPAGGAGLAFSGFDEAKSIRETSKNDMRASMHHLGENSFFAEYIFSRCQRLCRRFFFADFLRVGLCAAAFERRSASRVFFGSFAKIMS
jgi:hypothetical protein